MSIIASEVFGVELRFSQNELNETPPEISAAEYIVMESDPEVVTTIQNAAAEVESLVTVSRKAEDGEDSILHIFTGNQILAMQERIHSYLGMSLEEHLESPSMPPGYPAYVGKLATYFMYDNDDVTNQFGDFADRHIDPYLPKARGPQENNSREYALWGVQEILDQFSQSYQPEITITLNGPTKVVEGSRKSWERGVAECHFLILDYMREQLMITPPREVMQPETNVMTVDDIEYNLIQLTVNRRNIRERVSVINPVLASQLDDAIESLGQHSVEVMHRGRRRVPKFRKYPENARNAIVRVHGLLDTAALLSEQAADQEDIPVIE